MPVDFIDFSGGINFDALPEEMASNQLVDGRNLDLRRKGIVKGRYSDTLYQSFSSEIDDCFYQLSLDTEGFITRCGTILYDGDVIVKDDCPDAKHRFCEYQEYLCWTDGEKNWKYKRTGIRGGFVVGVTSVFELTFHDFGYPIGLVAGPSDGYRTTDGRNCPTSGVCASAGGTTAWTYAPVEIGVEAYEFTSYTLSYCHEWEADYIGSDGFEDDIGNRFTVNSYNGHLSDFREVEVTYIWEDQFLGYSTTGTAPTKVTNKRSAIVECDAFFLVKNLNPLDGAIRYKVSFGTARTSTSALIYGNAGYLCTAFDIGTNLIGIPTSDDPQVQSRWLWRTEPGLSVFRLAKIIGNNHGTSYIDREPTGLSTEELAIDHVKPRPCVDLCEHQSLLYMLEAPNLVRYPIDYGDWEFYPELNYEPMGSSSLEGLRILSLGEELVCYTVDKIWRFIGANESEFVKKVGLADHILASPDGLASSGEGHFFLDYDGLIGFDSVRDIESPLPFQSLFHRSSNSEFAVEHSLLSESKLVYMNNELFIGYARSGSSSLDTLLVVHKDRSRAFLIDVGNFTNLLRDPVNKRIYYTTGTSIRQLSEQSTGASWTLLTKRFGTEMQSRFVSKALRFLKWHCDPGLGEIKLSMYYDSRLITEWTITGGRQLVRKRVEPGRNFNTLQFLIEGTLNSEFYSLSVEHTVGQF